MSKDVLKGSKFGSLVRKLRKEQQLTLSVVAASLRIDTAILSKIERGQRPATRDQVLQLANYFKVKEDDLLVAWLSDKIVYEVGAEDMALKALQVAEASVAYLRQPATLNKTSVIGSIRDLLKMDGRVAAAWLFGSFVRGDEQRNSDIDIMIEFNQRKKYSMFDLMDISFLLENELMRKVDLVEKGHLKDFALETASTDLIKIYG